MKQYNKLEEYYLFESESMYLIDNEDVMIELLHQIFKDFSILIDIPYDEDVVFSKEGSSTNGTIKDIEYIARPFIGTDLLYPYSLFIDEVKLSLKFKENSAVKNFFGIRVDVEITMYDYNKLNTRNICIIECELIDNVIHYDSTDLSNKQGHLQGVFDRLVSKLDKAGAMNKVNKNSGIF